MTAAPTGGTGYPRQENGEPTFPSGEPKVKIAGKRKPPRDTIRYPGLPGFTGGQAPHTNHSKACVEDLLSEAVLDPGPILRDEIQQCGEIQHYDKRSDVMTVKARLLHNRTSRVGASYYLKYRFASSILADN